MVPSMNGSCHDRRYGSKGGMGQRGERGVIMEENGVLRESKTPSGDLLG